MMDESYTLKVKSTYLCAVVTFSKTIKLQFAWHLFMGYRESSLLYLDLLQQMIEESRRRGGRRILWFYHETKI